MSISTFALYTCESRVYKSELSLIEYLKMLSQSITLNKFYRKTKTFVEGIHSVYGLDNFDMKTFDNKGILIDMFESTYIIDYLFEINNCLNPYGVKTIQSGIAYYEDDYTFSDEYFQKPFIEFVGSINSIHILIYLMKHANFKEYNKYTFTQRHNNDTQSIDYRLCIMKPYKDSIYVYIFNDEDFWENICTTINETDMSCVNEKSYLNLKRDKDFYILDCKGNIIKLDKMTIYNPYTHALLTELDVRYDDNIDSFRF